MTTTTEHTTEHTEVKRPTRAQRTLQFIVEHPGATFTEIHRATESGGEYVYSSTSRALDRLQREGAIRRERDGRCVRSYAL